jgi:hypothetical protein
VEYCIPVGYTYFPSAFITNFSFLCYLGGHLCQIQVNYIPVVLRTYKSSSDVCNGFSAHFLKDRKHNFKCHFRLLSSFKKLKGDVCCICVLSMYTCNNFGDELTDLHRTL